MSGLRWTRHVTYSGQDFDETQARAAEISAERRACGEEPPGGGYSREAFAQAAEERAEFMRRR